MKKNTTNHGYALLFAVLVSAVVLGVGVSILNVSRKEILLTAGAQQSNYAFYAADAGYECALYQDYINGSFSTSSPARDIYCGTTYVGSSPQIYYAPVTTTQSGQTYTSTFNIPVSQAGSCAAVTIVRNVVSGMDSNGSTTISIATSLTSDGFNVGWEGIVNGATLDDCNAPNNSKVERALKAAY